MNVREALDQYAEFAPMTVRDLMGVVRKQVIQVDVLKLAADFERALRAAAGKGHEQGHYSLGYNPDECVTAGVAAMVERGHDEG